MKKAMKGFFIVLLLFAVAILSGCGTETVTDATIADLTNEIAVLQNGISQMQYEIASSQGASSLSQSSGNSPVRWEHTFRQGGGLEDDSHLEMLNEMGAEGWQLILIRERVPGYGFIGGSRGPHHYLYYFKRPLP